MVTGQRTCIPVGTNIDMENRFLLAIGSLA
jgi:hypothetical protein